MFQQIFEALEKRRLELHKDLDSAAITKTTQLQLQKEGLESLSSAVQLAIDSDKVALADYSNIEFLAVKSFLQDASESLAKETLSTDLSPIVVSTLSQNIETTKLIETISSINGICSHSYSPALSSFVGINPKMAIGVSKGSKCNLILQTRDSRGEDVAEGGAEVRGVLTSGSEVHECVIKDFKEGRYEISFDSPVEKGPHQLHVTIDDVGITGSPLTIRMRDYGAITTPATYIQLQSSPLYVHSVSDVQYVSSLDYYIRAWNNGKEIKMLTYVYWVRGIAVDEQNGVIFAISTRSSTKKVMKFSLADGEVLASAGTRGSGELEFDWPEGICCTKDGLLVIGDESNKRVQVLESDLTFVRMMSCQSDVRGVSVDSSGNIHAAAGDRIEVFSISGEKLTEYGEGVLHRAKDVAFLYSHASSQSGLSFVTNYIEEKRSSVCIFDWRKDDLVHSFMVLDSMCGIDIDQEGTIFACVTNSKQVLKF